MSGSCVKRPGAPTAIIDIAPLPPRATMPRPSSGSSARSTSRPPEPTIAPGVSPPVPSRAGTPGSDMAALPELRSRRSRSPRHRPTLFGGVEDEIGDRPRRPVRVLVLDHRHSGAMRSRHDHLLQPANIGEALQVMRLGPLRALLAEAEVTNVLVLVL